MATEVHRHGRNASAERRAAAPLDPDEAGAQRRVVQADHSVPRLREKQTRYDLMAPRMWLHSRDSFTSRDIAQLESSHCLAWRPDASAHWSDWGINVGIHPVAEPVSAPMVLSFDRQPSDGVTTTWSTSTLSQARFSVTS